MKGNLNAKITYKYKKSIFSLSLFHAVVLEARRVQQDSIRGPTTHGHIKACASI